jgi:hypothetical protein
MLPLPAGDRQNNGDGTRWFHGRLAAGRVVSADAKMRQILAFWLISGPVCLDSGLRPAISPATRRGIFLALFVFARCAKIEPKRLTKKPARSDPRPGSNTKE